MEANEAWGKRLLFSETFLSGDEFWLNRIVVTFNSTRDAYISFIKRHPGEFKQGELTVGVTKEKKYEPTEAQ